MRTRAPIKYPDMAFDEDGHVRQFAETMPGVRLDALAAAAVRDLKEDAARYLAGMRRDAPDAPRLSAKFRVGCVNVTVGDVDHALRVRDVAATVKYLQVYLKELQMNDPQSKGAQP